MQTMWSMQTNMEQDEVLHAELMQAFSKYFKANQRWINTGTRIAGREVRYWLSEIRRLCSLRREHVRAWRKELDEIKKQKKEIQKAQGTDTGTTNQLMTWHYQDTIIEELPEDCVGFVYLITNLISGRKYIGKKLAKFSKTSYKVVKLKNGTKKKKKIRSKIDSDWREYYGSNMELNADVLKLGKENFKREVLYYCKSKAECSYIEAREQFTHKVLESKDYYNGQISVRVHGSHILKSQAQQAVQKASVS